MAMAVYFCNVLQYIERSVVIAQMCDRSAMDHGHSVFKRWAHDLQAQSCSCDLCPCVCVCLPATIFFVLFFPELGSDIRQTVHQKMEYLTLRSVSSLNNPQNSEMNFLWKYEVDMLKIIIIIISYTLNNFTTHIRISQQMMENI